jgi:hypothetical protein
VAPTPTEQVRQALAQLQEPIPVQQLQKLRGIRPAKICAPLAELAAQGEVIRLAAPRLLGAHRVFEQ